MATVAISSGCFGFSNRLAYEACLLAAMYLSKPVRVEAVVPRWGVSREIIQRAASVHYPLQFDCRGKLGERAYWTLLHGGPSLNPTHKVGLPMVIHAPTIKHLIGELGEDGFCKRFGDTTIWLENAESDDPQTDPIRDVIDAAKTLKSLGVTAGVCYDVGHAILRAATSGRSKHKDGRLSSRVILEDLERLNSIKVCAAHIHNFDPGATGKRDHKPLRAGVLDVEKTVGLLIERNQDIQLTLEVNYVGAYAGMLAMRTFGHGYLKARNAALKDLEYLATVVTFCS